MKYLLAIIFTMLATTVQAAERESYYSDLVCAELYSSTGSTLPSGIRPDCETPFAVIEFDWATRSKHYECIGQSLVYAEETGKLAVCVLLARNANELEFAKSLDLSPFGIRLVIIETKDWDPE